MSTSKTERDLATKSFGALEVKDADKGVVEAVVGMMETVDRDREVILKGAIADGARVKLSGYGHGAMFGDMPVGKGTLHTDGNRIVFRGKFFLSTVGGKDAFETLKEFGTDQEWSFGFRILDAELAPEEWSKQGAIRVLTKLEPFEVSPVLVGAGIGTRTVSMKCDGCGGEHKDEGPCDSCASKAAAQKQAHEEHQRRQQAEIDDEVKRFQRTAKFLGL